MLQKGNKVKDPRGKKERKQERKKKSQVEKEKKAEKEGMNKSRMIKNWKVYDKEIIKK